MFLEMLNSSDIKLNPQDLESMNHQTTEDPAPAAESLGHLEVVMRYHQESKHHFPAMHVRSVTWTGRIS